MKVCLCVGTRPNFMKAAPLIRAFKKHGIDYRLIHTGQHYDKNMSQIFFDELEIPEPDIKLGAWVEGDSSSQQIGRSMVIFSRQMELNRPDLIMVLGDVNSTLACALVANKMGIQLAHVEAGERSGDRSMPEEINRILVDEISDYLFCASEEAYNNLVDKKYPYEPSVSGSSRSCHRIAVAAMPYLVGDTMIDQLIYSEQKLGKATCGPCSETYAVLTIHRMGNVDNTERLNTILEIAHKIAEDIRVYFPCHPRTRKRISDNLIPKVGEKISQDGEKIYLKRAEYHDGLTFLQPMSYLEFMSLIKNAKFVMTDSGGLQVETSYLNIPCLTLRENTERHETILNGSNCLISIDTEPETLVGCVEFILNKKLQYKKSTFKSNPIHDGNASERIVEILKKEV